MTDNNELAGSSEYVPESLRTLAVYLERSLDNATSIVMMLAHPRCLHRVSGRPGRFAGRPEADWHDYNPGRKRNPCINFIGSEHDAG
ncbi:hypothetical protein HDG40_006514 [Paraburkholderia sp. JPY158]|uniref:Uncharacterized protein n=1 Tax=Paraburkholderia atlantica TaxID=2654982 RepID=A0A7W8QDA8_PARAM|nr:hypothetical protein [Paraburkholderia atlantica]